MTKPCLNGMNNQPPCRSKSDVAHEIRMAVYLGEITREQADEKLAKHGGEAEE